MLQKEDNQQKIVQLFLDRNILVQSDALPILDSLTPKQADDLISGVLKMSEQDDFLVLSCKLLSQFIQKKEEAATQEKQETAHQANSPIKNGSSRKGEVKVLFSYNEKSTKREVGHFVQYFRARYKALEQMLSFRKELQGRLSISRIRAKKDKESVSAIGMVSDIQLTKNNNLMVIIEDLTSSISVLINKNRSDELYSMAKNLVLDEVIGVEGVVSSGIIFANTLIQPDVPLTKEFKKSGEEEYAAFLGDPHIGSRHFLNHEFTKFVNWINCKIGDERQKEIASKIKYLFIIGDIVDGVGIYPSQEDDLEIPDIYKQYDKFVNFLKQLPKDFSANHASKFY